MRSSPLLLLTLARLREFWREPSAVFWTFVFPILLAVALGLAFRNQKPTPPGVAVVEGPGAQQLARALIERGLAAAVVDEATAQHRLRTNKVVLVLRAEIGGELVYRYDPAQPEAVDARLKADDAIQRAEGRRDSRPSRDDLVTAPGARYIDWLIPGLVGMQLMSGSLWGIAFGLAQTRQKKLLKRLIATPMTKLDYLSSLVISRLIFVLLELPVLLGFGWFAFGVQLHGSAMGVLFLSMLRAASFAGLALLCGCRAGNQETASGLVNLAQLPMLLVSGVFFSSARFPDSLQGAIRLLPLTAMNDSLRALINDGAPLSSVTFEIVVMAAWGLVCGAPWPCDCSGGHEPAIPGTAHRRHRCLLGDRSGAGRATGPRRGKCRGELTQRSRARAHRGRLPGRGKQRLGRAGRCDTRGGLPSSDRLGRLIDGRPRHPGEQRRSHHARALR